MNRTIQMRAAQTPVPSKRIPVKKTLEMKTTVAETGITEPIRIGQLIAPVRQIINHPERDSLLAELFKDYK